MGGAPDLRLPECISETSTSLPLAWQVQFLGDVTKENMAIMKRKITALLSSHLLAMSLCSRHSEIFSSHKKISYRMQVYAIKKP